MPTNQLLPLHYHALVENGAGAVTILDNTSPTNDSTVCHPILLAQGYQSIMGICDDNASALVVAAIVLFVHMVLVAVNLSGLMIKWRQMKNVSATVNFLTVARSPALMALGTLGGLLLTVIMTVRILSGRRQFPCVGIVVFKITLL